MSYCRNPHYIYPTLDGVQFNSVYVPDEAIDIWLYNMLLRSRREELRERILHGKAMELRIEDSDFNILPEDHPEVELTRRYQEMNEDQLFKFVIGEDIL